MKLIFTLSAQRDLIRLREFIAEKNPDAARRISQELKQSIKRIVRNTPSTPLMRRTLAMAGNRHDAGY